MPILTSSVISGKIQFRVGIQIEDREKGIAAIGGLILLFGDTADLSAEASPEGRTEISLLMTC